MRHLTTTRRAAGHYVAAARAVCTGHDPTPHLVAAADADPAFAVAVVDLALLTRGTVPPVARPASRWEREHIDIARAVACGQLGRAEGLLHEHLADGGCDPLAAVFARREARNLRPTAIAAVCPFTGQAVAACHALAIAAT